MAVFRCKMCGGSLRMAADKKTGICEFCGSEQTVPTISNAEVASLYEQANNLRRGNNFDKANEAYAKVLTSNGGDPESYWSMVLCKYGIEYVEDPGTKKRVPTVNRTQFLSIFDDANYKKAIQLASPRQREIYVAEATKINEVQKGILEVSKHEAPYDVFISYKETDEYGRRTRDSVYAHEIYNELTRQGLRVFFAPVSLQNILGAAYEPHIFAALNSAKVMVVIGTSKEMFEAVWVKNEWSRFLGFIKEGKRKTLIPAFRDMDPYDLPPEFARLQALNMAKLGFMVDLVEGVKKLVDNSKSAQVAASASGGTGKKASKLLERSQLFLEDGDWGGAKDAINDILRRDPENGEAYFYLLMAQARVKNQEELANHRRPLSNYSAYRSAIKYGDDQTVDLLRSMNAQITESLNTRPNPAARPAATRPAPAAADPKLAAIRQHEANIRKLKAQMGRFNGKKKMGRDIIAAGIIGFFSLLFQFICIIAFGSQYGSYEQYRNTSYSKYYPFPVAPLVFTLIFSIIIWVTAIILLRKMYKLSPKSKKAYIALVIFAPQICLIVCFIRDIILIKSAPVESANLSAEQNAQLQRLREQLTEEEMALEALKQR